MAEANELIASSQFVSYYKTCVNQLKAMLVFAQSTLSLLENNLQTALVFATQACEQYYAIHSDVNPLGSLAMLAAVYDRMCTIDVLTGDVMVSFCGCRL